MSPYKSFATIPPGSIMTKRKKCDLGHIAARKCKACRKIREGVVSNDIKMKRRSSEIPLPL